jgi:hypothetical protein
LDRKNLRAVARTAALGAVLGLAGGYVVFYGVFPVAGVPGTSEASIPFVLGLLSFTSVLVGLATENLVEMTFQAFVGLFLSGAVASAMALSPSFLGVVFISPDSIPAFLIHYGFLLFVFSFIVNLMGGTVGLLLRERYFIRGTRGLSAWAERK